MHIATLIDILERLLHKFYLKPKEDHALMEAAKKFRAKVPPRKGIGPNKAVEPTPVAVTPPADAGGAPSTSAAHLGR